MPKATILDKNETLMLLNGFLDEFQNCINQSKKPTPAEFEKWLSNHFQITSNGKAVAHNLKEYISHIESFQKRYSHCDIHLIQDECVCADHHFTCVYRVDLIRRNNQKVQLHMMAIATIEHDRITKWLQVAHEKGTSHWDKE